MTLSVAYGVCGPGRFGIFYVQSASRTPAIEAWQPLLFLSI